MELRTLTSADEFRQVFALEQEVWGSANAGDSVPVMMLLVSTRIGGLVIGAYDGDRLAGFAYALPGIRDGKPFQWSHMLGVASRYRNSGLGYRIKIEQRRQVMASGLDLIAWTCDPLQALNAHLNFAKLGATAGEYHLDAYPGSTSPLHAGTSTDRLVAEWRLSSDRALERLACAQRAEAPPRDAGPVPPVNRVGGEGSEWPAPHGHDLAMGDATLRLTIPMGFTEMQQRDLALAKDWRAATREIFCTYLARGYRVTDFILDRPRRRGSYLLSRA